MASVTVVVPNYNGIQYIQPCLKSLSRQTFSDFEVVVVDNGSTDGSKELVLAEFPEAELLSLDKNYGFCGAVNRGIQRATGDYVLLLNNDTVVEKDFLEQMVAGMKRDERIFSASAKMIQMHQKDIIDDAGNFYCALGWGFARGKDQPVTRFEKECNTFSACGGAVIYQRVLLEKTGMFDEAHFAYLEDVDIGYRGRIYGYKNKYFPKAIVYHAGSATSGSRYNEFKIRLSARNNVYLVYKNMPVLQLLLNLPFLLVGTLIKALFFTKKGYGALYLKSLGEGITYCVANRKKKVKFRSKNILNYCKIQLELWFNILRKCFSF